MEPPSDAGGTLLQLPRGPRPSRRERKVRRVGDSRFYPRRFHPYRDPAPFFLPILITVIGAVLSLGSGWAVLHLQKSWAEAQQEESRRVGD